MKSYPLPLGALTLLLVSLLLWLVGHPELAQWLLLIVVLLVPGLVHFGDKASDMSRAPLKELSIEEINKRLREMVPLPPLETK